MLFDVGIFTAAGGSHFFGFYDEVLSIFAEKSFMENFSLGKRQLNYVVVFENV